MNYWNNHCFLTGDRLSQDEPARFTFEFDAWVSLRGQKMIEDAANKNELISPSEKWLIHREWSEDDDK